MENATLIDFNFTATDDVGFTNCTLYGNFSGNWKPNSSITTIADSAVNNITISLQDGTYL